MHLFASLALLLAPAVHASVFVTNPVQSSQCAGGQPCQVQWVDDGQAPLLTAIGNCDVGLYTGQYQRVQSLPSVDVSSTPSFTFTPDPAAGPNGQYYLVFTASGINYQGFSGSFTLTGMSGTTPGGGSSTPASTATSSGSSTSAGSTTPGTSSGTPTASSESGTSNSVTGTNTPTDSTSSASPTLTTPTVSTSQTSESATTPTTTPSRTTSSVPTSASATPSSAAGRVGSSTSLGGIAALLVLSGVFAF